MIDIEKYMELSKEIGDKQIALKDRLNNILKKCFVSNPQKLVEVDDINGVNIGTDGKVYFNCIVTPKYDIRLSYPRTLIVDKTLLTMSDEEFNNLDIVDFNRSKYKPITFKGLI